MAHEAGKGDVQRPTDHKKFSSGYDGIDWSFKGVTCPNCGGPFTISSQRPHTHVCKPKAQDAETL